MVAQLKWGRLNQGLVAQSRSFKESFISNFSNRFYSSHTFNTFFQVADKDLVAVNEQVQLKALKNFYDR